ncbi:uncharacterized protein LOC135121244 [Zophobas morio]|uniref:uncharacterized protein LOC135121244 n=1 Tax=Zophobas morio TaxID=2755281 RepID=UPI003082FE01
MPSKPRSRRSEAKSLETVCYYQNVRGLNTKLKDFSLSTITSLTYDIVALTETWLNDSVSDAELFDLSIYSVFRSDLQFNEIVNNTEKVLDLVLSNQPCSVDRALDILTNEDIFHPALEVTVKLLKPDCNSNKFPIVMFPNYNFRKANLHELYADLESVDWSVLNDTPDVDLAVDASVRAKIKTETHKVYTEYVNKLNAEINSNPKCFWSYLNSLRNTTSIPPLMKLDDWESEDPQAIVNKFATYFSTAFSLPSNNSGINTYRSQNNSGINANALYITNNVTENEVLKAMLKLKASMTAGPDLFPSFLIRDCRFIFAGPLKVIFNNIIKSCMFPEQWKISRVCPIFKQGDKSVISKYRPVAIINNFAKVFEIILFDRVYSHVSNRISIHQHGFMADQHKQVDVAYLDFSKAFDRVNHKLLIMKLEYFGLSNDLLKLISSYLCNRCQFVQYRGFRSDTFVQRSGVPQGSVFEYSMDGSVLKRSKTIKDLGVMFDSKMSFCDHYDSIIASSYKTLGFVLRNDLS